MVEKVREVAKGDHAMALPWKNSREQIAIVKSPAIVDRLIYKGSSTLLVAKPKVGKTTLALDICEAVILGRSFFKEEVEATSVLYVSEQGLASFLAELNNSGLLTDAQLQLGSDTHKEQLHFVTIEDFFAFKWRDIVKDCLEHALAVGAVLVVYDTLSRIAHLENENDASEMQAAVEELTPLMKAGISTLIVQHERKGGGDIADAGRGTNALLGSVDTILRLNKTGGKNPATQRKLEMLGRFAFPPESRVIDRATADSRSRYELQGYGEAVTKANTEQTVLNMFDGDCDVEYSQDEILEETEEESSRSTVKRAIKNLVKVGLLTKTGDGKKDSPYKFRLKEAPF
jgi:hypothetical protein